jgi:glycosyltransferase involved in cell wall biosynthesis
MVNDRPAFDQAAGPERPGLRPIACLFSTSGHSGVDRIARHLLPGIAGRGYRIDQLKVRRHGPVLDATHPNLRVIDLGHRNTYACLPAVVRYLRRERPVALLSDKDRVNRTALLARTLAHPLGDGETRLLLRLGTTVSVNLASRGAMERLVQRASMRYLYPRADAVLVPSQGVADDLSVFAGLGSERLRVVPSPVVPEALLAEPPPAPDHPWFGDPRMPLVLGMGELGPRKDFATLLRAFARLRSGRRCRLMILGRGRERESLLQLAASLGIAADVELPGFITEPYPYLAHADLFAFTSLWEGLGFVLIEALALGTPVVSTDCPSGPREILADGRFGRLVAVGDDQAFAEAMRRTLDAPPQAELLRTAAEPYGVERAVTAYLAAMGLPPTAA